jgi:hypothetical protein
MNLKRLPTFATVIVLAPALALAACGGGSSSKQAANPNAGEQSPPGDIPDNQVFVRLTPHGSNFSVRVPEGWARSSAGGAVSFTDKLNTIHMQELPAGAALTVKAAKQNELPKLAQTVRGFRAGTITTVSRPAGQAVRITYLARAKPSAVTGKAGTDAVERYVFFHNGKDVVLTLSGPRGADNVDPWKIVTSSVRWTT